MAKRHCPENFETTINRWYIDTRPYVPEPHNPKYLHTLPLLSTLKHADQEAVTRFLRPADRFMSLASALLKYTFIHRRAKIPWEEVQISRSPAPHRRPYWEPPENWSTIDIYDDNDPIYGDPCRIRGLEFNVSHQAGLVTILGCSTPTPQLPSQVSPCPAPKTPIALDSRQQIDLDNHPTCTAFEGCEVIRLGVDIACTNEDKRTPKDLTTQAKFDEWIEIFAEMFSDRERRHMRTLPIHVPVKEREEGDWSDSNSSSPSSSLRDSNGESRAHEAKLIDLKLRRFYAYWGLKEAYIKMVGEGLLASWLRELEFLDVRCPPPPPPGKADIGGRSPLAPGHEARNSNVTPGLVEAQGVPFLTTSESNAPRKSVAAIPSLPAVNETTPSMTSTNGSIDMTAMRRSIAAIDTNLPTATSLQRRKSLTPTADMYGQRRPSIPTSDAVRPRKLSFPAKDISPVTAHVRGHEYLSPFPDSPSSTSSLFEQPRPSVGQEDGFHHPEPGETAKWTPPDQAERAMTTLFKGRRVEDVEIELVAYDTDFMIATAMRGVKEREVLAGLGTLGEDNGWWLRLDFEKDIRPCAEGRCNCLDED